jgi:hypothetical protein
MKTRILFGVNLKVVIFADHRSGYKGLLLEIWWLRHYHHFTIWKWWDASVWDRTKYEALPVQSFSEIMGRKNPLDIEGIDEEDV